MTDIDRDGAINSETKASSVVGDMPGVLPWLWSADDHVWILYQLIRHQIKE